MTALRNFCFTYFGSFNDVQSICTDDRIQYCIAQEEVCPETKREHVQGYIQLRRSTRFNTVRDKILPAGAHIEPSRGSPQENRQYCSKLESRKPGGRSFEHGEIREQGARNDLVTFKRKIDEGASESDIAKDDTLFPVWAKHPMLYKRYKTVHIKPRDYNKPADVSFFTGAPGVGKTKRVFEQHKQDVYFKDNTKWWDGYVGQTCILLDELETNEHWKIETMLRFLDRYPYQGQTKGGYVEINSPFIAITSNKQLGDLFPSASPDQLNALNRRINQIVQL